MNIIKGRENMEVTPETDSKVSLNWIKIKLMQVQALQKYSML